MSTPVHSCHEHRSSSIIMYVAEDLLTNQTLYTRNAQDNLTWVNISASISRTYSSSSLLEFACLRSAILYRHTQWLFQSTVFFFNSFFSSRNIWRELLNEQPLNILLPLHTNRVSATYFRQWYPSAKGVTGFIGLEIHSTQIPILYINSGVVLWAGVHSYR